jgi:DNA invertase Pin-like site-specific DNA recombinase
LRLFTESSAANWAGYATSIPKNRRRHPSKPGKFVVPEKSGVPAYNPVYDPTDPMGKLFFNILATFAEFEADLIRMRTREGMAIARAKGKLKGKQPKLSDKQQKELCRIHATGDYSISDLAELFSVSRPTVYRTLNRHRN